MKFRSLLLILSVAALSAFGGWKLAHHQSSGAASSGERKVLFYQSPMHPWIKSDQPGNCTICGMKLVPVLEGDKALDDTADASAVKLSPQSLSVIQVASVPVTRQPLRRTIRVAGRIDDDDSAHRRLSARVDGRIDKLFVNFVGAEVTAGQPLASFYSRDLLAARSEYTLATKQPPSPERDGLLVAIKAKLRRLGLTPEQIEHLPNQTGDTVEILAPVSGTVVERKVYEGQYVKEGEVLFEIADFSKMWFVFDAYERDLAWIRTGQSVEVSTPSVPGKVFTAPIAFIDPNLVMETRTAKVRVILDNPHVGDPAKHRHELLHKVYADGRIKVETEPVLTVPRSAVLSPGGDPLVYVVKSETAYEPRRVTLGRVGDDVWEIVAGLAEGERVVTTGNLLLDAQAQLDRGSTEAPAMEALNDAQKTAARSLIESVAALAEALAADDLAAHNARIEAAHSAAMSAFKELGDAGKRLGDVAHLASAKDLAAARKQFYPLATISADLATQLRREPEFRDVKIFECPMAKTAVPSAETNQGRWLQMKGPLRNPYFGAEMLECGTEVKP